MKRRNEVVFRSAVESLFAAVGEERRTPALLGRLAARGLKWPDVRHELPRALWNQVVADVATSLYPDKSIDDAHFALGREFTSQLSRTVSGRAQVAMGRLLGPMKTLKLFSNMLSTGTNYSEATVTTEGECAAEFWINETGEQNPGFFAGLLTAALELAGAKDVEMKLKSVSVRDGATYGVTWT
ncbi:MAG: DUF2378 family protein [Archangium sp.]